jgi:hypothetical protein
VFRPSDGDATFMAPVNGAMNFPAGHLLDKPWLAVDNFAGPGQGNLYLAFTDVEDDICFTRSTDGVATWPRRRQQDGRGRPGGYHRRLGHAFRVFLGERPNAAVSSPSRTTPGSSGAGSRARG